LEFRLFGKFERKRTLGKASNVWYKMYLAKIG